MISTRSQLSHSLPLFSSLLFSSLLFSHFYFCFLLNFLPHNLCPLQQICARWRCSNLNWTPPFGPICSNRSAQFRFEITIYTPPFYTYVPPNHYYDASFLIVIQNANYTLSSSVCTLVRVLTPMKSVIYMPFFSYLTLTFFVFL